MRMSSGASFMYEKPRSDSSSCGEDTPRSNSIPSAPSMPSESSIAAASEKLPWTSVTLSLKGARRLPARSMAVSSLSMQMRRPEPSREAI